MTGWQSADRAKADFRSCAFSVRFSFIQSLRWTSVAVTSIEFALSPGMALSVGSSRPLPVAGFQAPDHLGPARLCDELGALWGRLLLSVTKEGAGGGEAEVPSL